jgi:hypothetical protein
MAMSTTQAIETMLSDDEGVSLVRPEVGALEAITRSEVAMQLDSAHRWPRSVKRFLQEAISLATLSTEVAESCMYSVPRDAKMITGPSVRLAEMCASAWGNLHVGARVVDVGEREVTAQGVAWDLEKNLRLTVEVPRSITSKTGKRFSESMIQTTGLAAISIAYRNAVFRIIPRAYVDAVYQKAKAVAVGDAKTLVTRREEVLARIGKLGVTPERVFKRLEVAGLTDMTLEHIETLIGLGTAISTGEIPLDEAFPVLAPAPVPEGTPEGKRVKLGKSKAEPAKADAKPDAKPAAATKAEAAKAEPKAQPKPANDVPISGPPVPLNWTMVHKLLAKADKAWNGDDRLPIVMGWTQDQLRAAYAWALAFTDTDSYEDEQLPARPEHTRLERMPGED